MADDFFADLVPMRPKETPRAPENGGAEARQQRNQDAVLGRSLDKERGLAIAEVPDLLGQDVSGEATQREALKPSSYPTPELGANAQVKEIEGAVEATMRRFASGLQRVLEDINRRLESLETSTERISKAVSDVREAEVLREGSFKKGFGTLSKDLREVHRSLQLLRDKQELLEAQAELAKLSATKKVETAPAAPPPTPANSATSAPAAEPLASAPSATSQVSAELPKPATPAAPSMPAPTVPPMPPSIQAGPPQAPPQAPQPPAHQYSVPTASQPAQYPGSQERQTPQYLPTSQSAPQPVAQGYPPQAPPHPHAPPQAPPPAPQYSAPPPPSHQYSAPPQQQRFQPPAPPYSGGQGGDQPGAFAGTPQSDTQSGYQGGYPSLSQPRPLLPNAPLQPHRYHHGGAQPPSGGSSYSRHDYGPQPPPRSGPYRESIEHGSGGARPQPPSGSSGQAASRNIPLEQVIDDVANMGFSRHEVRDIVSELMSRGQAVDLNVVLDRLMNGPRR